MAFTSVGARGHTNAKAAGTTLTISPSTSIAAGQLLVVWVAWEGAGLNQWNSHLDISGAVSDDAGNLYTGVATTQFAIGGPYVGIFVCQLQHALTGASVITFTFGSSTSAKAMSLWEFTLDPGFNWAVTDEGPVAVKTVAGQPPTVTVPTLDSQEYLALYGMTTSGPATDSFTLDGSYTAIASDGTTGGADNTNRTLNGGHKIVQATSVSATGITDNTAARDNCVIIVALAAVPDPGAFPVMPILDDFNRANENPLSGGGNWDTVCIAGPTSTIQLLANQAANNGAGHNGQWWTTQNVTNSAEVYMSIPVGVVGDPQSWAELYCGGGCSNTGTIHGFATIWANQVAGWPSDIVAFGTRLGAGGLDNERSYVGATRPNGAKLGMRKFGPTMHQWMDAGSGWVHVSALYVNQPGLWDPTKMGIGLLGSSLRLDDFGGGDVPSLLHLLPILHVGS